MHSPVKTNALQQQNKHKKLQPGLVASYDIQPGNGEGLFLFWRLITCHLLTYLLSSKLLPSVLRALTLLVGRQEGHLACKNMGGVVEVGTG